jgi:prepilin-type N-terminal cleavage/methylation domain-containing protein
LNSRAGFTLMEHMIAVTMLGVAAAGLAPVVMSTARHTRVAQSNQYETAALTEMVSRYGALSFGALTAGTTCTNHASGGEPMPHRRCVTITDSAGVLRRVRIIVTPYDSLNLRPDTLIMRRVRTISVNPLNVP